jgi:hypothetical protein
MARVTVTFEDRQLLGQPDVEVRIESADPPLPIATVTDPRWIDGLGGGTRDLDLDAATPAQAMARMAVGEVAGHARAAKLVVRPE